MDRKQLKKHILDYYDVTCDSPFSDSPTHEVFRHPENRKWFALVLDVKREKLGLDGESNIDILNLKCDTAIIGSIRMNKGIFPAYHMNKSNWISVALDGSADDEMIKMLICESFNLTRPKIRKRKPE